METSAPGWYGEPGNAAVERFWDGAQWTPRTRTAANLPAAATPTDTASTKPTDGRPDGLPPTSEPAADSAPEAGATERSRRRDLVGGAFVAILVLGGLLYWFVLRTPVMSVRGTMDLNGARDENYSVSAADSIGNTSCTGLGGYSDISEGTSVTITDGSGKTIAITHLEKGMYIDGTAMCLFPFEAKIPANLSFYGIQVSHRGNVQFSKTDMTSGPGVTLGQ